MSVLRSAMTALDLGNAVAWTRMGLRNKQVFDVFGAYFRGVELPRAGATIGMNALAGLKSRPMIGAVRAGALGFGALATWNMLPRNNAVAIPGGMAAGFGTAYMMGQTPIAKARGALGLRAGAGLLAGSLIYQGLRAAPASEYQVRM